MSKRMYEYLDSKRSENEAKDGNPLRVAIIATIVIISLIFMLATYFI